MRTTEKLLGLCLVVSLLVVPQVLAQNPTGTLTGQVTDADGANLPGVTVTATSPALQGVRTTQTGVNGAYKFPYLPAGDYEVKFELEGFATNVAQVRIFAAQSDTLNTSMELAEVYEEIVVTGNIEAISETNQVATTVDQSELESLPINRTITQAVQLAPGVHATGPRQNLTISGAMSFENLWLINGVVVNENIRGQSLPLYIEDAVQETTTATAGISAEYGRFGGGVINVLTKSGGNEFSGSLRVNFNNDEWQNRTPISGEQTDEINETYEATLGGPFWKDKLWFFAAGRDLQTSATNQTRVTNIVFPTENINRRYEGKLTFGITSSHNVIGSYIEIESERTNSGFGTYLDLASLSDRSDPQDITSINYTGILTSSFFVEATWSERNYIIGIGSGGVPDLIQGTMMRNRGTGYRYYAPTFCGSCENEMRDNENLRLTSSYFLTTEGGGTHDIVFGYDTFEDIRFAINHQTGSDFTVWSSDLIITDDNRIYPQFLGPTTWIGWWAVFNLDIARPTSFNTNSFFINDSWQLNEKWAFNIGVRYDENDGTDSGGNLTVDDAKFSPRIGLTWDVKGDGDLVFNASYGTYVAAIANSRADATSQGGAIGLFLMEYGGPLVNVDDNCDATGSCVPTAEALQTLFDWYFANGGTTNLNDDLTQLPNVISASIPGATAIVPDTLKSPSTDELTVGMIKRLGDKGIFRADLIYREGNDFYSNRIDLATGQVETSAGLVDQGWVGNFGDDVLERKYTGVNLQGRYRFTDRLTVAGNYTWSRLKGNIEGENRNSGPVPSSPHTYPEYREIEWGWPVGYLSSDQRHKVRLWATYDLIETEHHALRIGFLQSYFSGVPYGAGGAVDTRPYVTNPGYAIPPSSVGYYFTAPDAYRTDNITRTDVSINYSFRWNLFGKSMEVFIQPEVVNLWNEQGLDYLDFINTNVFDATNRSSLQTFNPWTDTPVEGVHWERASNFGGAEDEDAYQQPRTFRFSIGFRF